MVEEQTGESKDGQGAGDRDTAYAFGNPRAGLTLLVQARLTIMRGDVLDASHATTHVRYDDDSDSTESGLLVPITAYWPDEA